MDYKELGVGNKINMMRLKDAMGVRTKPKQYVSKLLDLDVSARVVLLRGWWLNGSYVFSYRNE